ncbi:LTA synthase family protein [Atopococcus tabaci]|uniref:LTA synthase family protein n=1 Tax=Atopococcus tabaci TaxID=269774 RepID=UPI00041A7188|nr:LTA synthase family protein [Atopococcus tabaci]
MNRLKYFLGTRVGFFSAATLLFWLKSYIAYQMEFALGVTGGMQELILFINPIATTVILFSVALYFKKPKTAYSVLFVVYFLLTLLLYANILYYREFSDFLTMGTVFGAGNVSGGLFASTIALLRLQDVLYWLDFALLVWAVTTKRIPIDPRPMKKRVAIAATTLGAAVFSANLTLAESDRPQLLTRTFDRNYIVKYLGLNFYTAYDAYQTFQNNQMKANAEESDMVQVLDYVNSHYAEPNPDMFGIAEGRNVIYIELESVQQFLIDYKLEDENGELHEVTPFLNSLFHDEASHSFENFFHQTGQGKTSDAEMLVENSLYGLPQGGAFTQLGGENTFHSTSKILENEGGYTSAVFHGNVGSFWNRTNTYESFGIDYFFDAQYYDMSDGRTMEYGLKDKLFYQESAKYLEQLPQPFYTKFMPVTHHFPYPLDEANADIPAANTSDETINNFFVTAHYMDEAIEEFFTYLKESGLYENSMIVLYGDHYGISNARNKTLAPLLDKDPETWNGYDNTMLQRVPLIIHIPGVTDGQVHETYGGQTDVMPTILHLLGVETKDYILMGSDLFSSNHAEMVPLRNGNVITPKYTILGSSVYDTDSGELLEDISPEEEAEIEAIREEANKQLSASDSVLMKDLLRFYTPEGLEDEKEMDYLYSEQLPVLQNEENKETSLIEQNGGQSTADLYETNAPELMTEEELAELMESKHSEESEENTDTSQTTETDTDDEQS